MKEHILSLLEETLPAVDFKSEFLFSEIDSLGVATILMMLEHEYDIPMSAADATPKNLKSVDSLVSLVERKLKEKFAATHLTLEAAIRKFAAETPDKTAAVCSGDSITYSKLWENIEKRAAELGAAGLKPHRPYVFRASQNIDFLITYCAVHVLKAIAVPLEHACSDENFKAVKDEVDACTFADDIVDTLYTTGTTGKSKGVMLSETALVSCADNFIHDLGFTGDLLFIISGPLNHIASLFKIHPILTVGGTACILDGMKDMNAFFDVFDLPFKKFGTFMVPASLRMIMQFSYEKLCSLADKFDFIETGAAPITQTDMEMLSKALPRTRLYNTYGGTEIGAVCTYNFNDGKYMEGCVGRPMKNSSVEVTPDGSVIVSGLTIMSGYVSDEESTRAVIQDGKIHGADLGYVDEDGMIHLTGRSGDVINVGGYKVNPVEVENAASSHPSVKDCICIAATHPVIGNVLKLLVVPADGMALDKHALAVHIKSKLDAYKVPTYYETVDSIARTYNGKIDRKFYRK
ncbi:MAG: AMP-binding protein [Bacteroidales bacterium]|nr:AMP-binding protein [Bacteroidales bacterium]